MDTLRELLIDELDSFDPHWRIHYPTLVDAVQAAGEAAEELFSRWKGTGEGLRLQASLAGLHDYQRDSRTNQQTYVAAKRYLGLQL